MPVETVTYRAEVVGSMLRPEYLKQARDEHASGALDAREFKRIEDRAVDEAIAVQEESGVDVVSDGELRRFGFIGSLIEIVEGIGPAAGALTEWHRDSGETEDYQAEFAVLDRLRRVRSLAVEEYVYARSRTDLPVKVTLPSPLMLGYFWSPEHTSKVYDDVFALIDDGARILREEIAELVRLGCPYIQIDAPELGRLGHGRGVRGALRRAQRPAGAGDGAPLAADPRRARRGLPGHDVRPAPVPRQQRGPLAGGRRLRAPGQGRLRGHRQLRRLPARVRRRAGGVVRGARRSAAATRRSCSAS